jgi:hypothetical protein
LGIAEPSSDIEKVYREEMVTVGWLKETPGRKINWGTSIKSLQPKE